MSLQRYLKFWVLGLTAVAMTAPVNAADNKNVAVKAKPSRTAPENDNLIRNWIIDGDLKIKTICDKNGNLMGLQAWNKNTGEPVPIGSLLGRVPAVDSNTQNQIAELQMQNQQLSEELRALASQINIAPPPAAEPPQPPLAQRMEKLEQKVEKIKPAKDWASKWELSGKAWVRYSQELEKAKKDFNEFALDRAYLTAKTKTSDKGSVRWTWEAGSDRDANGYYDSYTKYLYYEHQGVFGDNGYFRAGAIPLGWHEEVDSFWTIRPQYKSLTDYFGYSSAGDLGLTFGGKFDDDLGNWQLNAINGEGYKKGEGGSHKELQGRLFFKPLKSGDKRRPLYVGFAGIGGTYEGVATGPKSKSRFFSHIEWQEPQRWTLGSTYFQAQDPASQLKGKFPSLAARDGLKSEGSGWDIHSILNFSLFSKSKVAKEYELFLRHDVVDPDDKIANNELTHCIAGISRKWDKNNTTFVSYEDLNQDSGAGKSDERRILVTNETNF